MPYLSRLARQSGLHTGPAAAGPAPIAPAPSPAPLEVDEERDAPAVSAPGRLAPLPAPLVEAAPASIAHTSQAEHRLPSEHHSPPRIERESEVVRETARADGESASPHAAGQHSRTVLSTLADRVKGAWGEVHEIHEERAADPVRGESGAVRATVERMAQDAAGPAQAARTEPSPAPAARESVARTFSERLAEVRAWVAATPAPGELADSVEVWESQDERATGVQGNTVSGRPPPSSAREVDALAAGAPSEVNHFTLSIGSIQLTVDEPPRPAPAAPAAPSPRAAALPAASRLGSHYLRA
jgi:hypothetical protein